MTLRPGEADRSAAELSLDLASQIHVFVEERLVNRGEENMPYKSTSTVAGKYIKSLHLLPMWAQRMRRCPFQGLGQCQTQQTKKISPQSMLRYDFKTFFDGFLVNPLLCSRSASSISKFEY